MISRLSAMARVPVLNFRNRRSCPEEQQSLPKLKRWKAGERRGVPNDSTARAVGLVHSFPSIDLVGGNPERTAKCTHGRPIWLANPALECQNNFAVVLHRGAPPSISGGSRNA